jgi:CheY-like chemotaxis protein
VLRNLLENAIKFTPAGGKVTLRTDRGASGHVALSVTDTGIGIPAEDQGRIFDAYAQLESGAKAGGLGIGLHLARKLVEAQQGSITVTSGGTGQGSTFTVSLPRASQPAAPDKASPSTNGPGRLRVLLAEDHEDSARLIAELLASRGFTVTAVGSLGSALAEAGKTRFDVLVSDLELPDGSGLDLMRRMRSSQEVHGIALSGRRTEADLSDSRAAGFAVHLLKPIDFDALLSAIGAIGAIDRPG